MQTVRDARRVRARFPFLDAPTPLAFAHRGASVEGLENSMVAFEAAVRLGYRYLETDVRSTRDGVLVAFHDATLRRVTGVRGRIDGQAWTQLRTARIGGLEPIPLLEDLLGAWPDVRINLDVKVSVAIGPLVDTIRRTGAIDRVCVAAFSDVRLARIRAALGPRLCTSLGPRAALALRARSFRAPPRRARAAAVPSAAVPCAQLPARLGRLALIDRRIIDEAHRQGMQVHAWTVNDADDMRWLLDLGVDGIMTDRAELLRDLLLARGQWRGGRAA
jgi:glycerophosphoryl diester phosphodiesterase